MQASPLREKAILSEDIMTYVCFNIIKAVVQGSEYEFEHEELIENQRVKLDTYVHHNSYHRNDHGKHTTLRTHRIGR